MVCLECRTLHASACPHGHGAERSVLLATARGRELLLTQVWGPPKKRKHAAYPGWYQGPLAPPRSSDDDFDPIGEVMLWLLDRFVGRLFRHGRPWRVLLPVGGLTPPALVVREALRGTVRAVVGEPREPVTATPCVAYAAVFTYGVTHDVVLREAATCGFELELEDGGRLVVPAGECELALGGCERRLLEATTRVRELDPLGKEVEALPPFPHDHVQVRVLREGDRVEVGGPFTPLARIVEGDVGYRSAPARVLAPHGMPRLCVLARRDAAPG